jgi:predicted amino acid-binding ACT domain protein
LSKPTLKFLSKDHSVSIIFAERPSDNSFFINIFYFFEVLFSPFASIRIFEYRFLQSRAIILKELKKANINIFNIKISISHNKFSFVALVSKNNINIAVDHELRGRNVSNALEKKIDVIKKPESLSSIEFINIIETLVKITNKGWQSLIMNLEISKMGDIYLTNLNNDSIYSKFYGYNGSRVCISSDNLEIFK